MKLDEFTVFYDAYFSTVRGVAEYILGDERESISIADLTLWYAFCHPDKFLGMADSAVKAYLVRMARTRSYDELRRRHRNCYTDISLIENTPYEASDESVEKLVEIRDFWDTVHRCVSAMPEIYRDTLILKITKGMTLTEVAQTLGIPFDTAKTRCRRGIALLKRAVRLRGYSSL